MKVTMPAEGAKNSAMDTAVSITAPMPTDIKKN